MRIAHVTATFPPYQAGTGNVCFHNALELAKRGHEVHVYTAGIPGVPAEETIAGVAVHRLAPLFQFGNAPFIPGLLRLKGFDIIHLHHPFIFGAEMIWLVSKIRDIPYVLTHHNDLIGTGMRQFLFEIYSAVWTKAVFGHAAKFAVVSIDHAAHCQLTHLFTKRWGDVVEVPNGVDTEGFHPGLDGSIIRQKYGISADARVVLFVGVLDRAHHFKGVEPLISAFSRLEIEKVLLMIIGDGDLRETFEGQAKTSGASERIVFSGAVANEEIPPYYAAANIVVLPSTPPESFGVVLIEAMACGIPVVAHDIPGVRSVIGHGVNGYLAAPGDREDLIKKLRLLLEMSPSERQKMGLAGRAITVKNYAWELIGERLEAIYKEILSTKINPVKSS